MSAKNKRKLNGELRPSAVRRVDKRAEARAEAEKAQADLAAFYAAEDAANVDAVAALVAEAKA